VIQRQVENAVSRRLLAGAFAEGDTVTVDHGPDGYAFAKAEVAEQAA
jgi:ATP-dependent Clp protease ATP-binding subunit ClpA